MLGLLILNLLVASAGAGLEYWRSRPRALPAFNADKIELRGIAENRPEAGRKAGAEPVAEAGSEYIPPDP